MGETMNTKRASTLSGALFALAALVLGMVACRFGTPTPAYPPEITPMAQLATDAPDSMSTRSPAPAAAAGQIVDNTDTGFQVAAGEWAACANGDCQGTCYGSDFLFADPACADCRASFTLMAPQAGDYDLWTWWPWGDDRATDTPFTVTTSEGLLTIVVDQRNSGDAWYYLTTLTLAAGETVVVEVTSSGSGYANADAVGLTPAGSGEPGPAAAVAVESEAPPPEEETALEAPTPDTEHPAVAHGEAIIIDHTCTDLTRIPDEWLQDARKLTVHFAHTSHGSQIISGLTRLAETDTRYAVAVQDWDPPGLPQAADALRIYDGNDHDGDTYIMPEMYWADADGLAYTQAVAATGLFDISMWSWCGQQSENSEAQVRQYLATMDELQRQFPEMRFVLMTGHSDGTTGGTLARNNQMVRDHAIAQGMILFDFEDIDTHAPDGSYYANDEEGTCTWCDDWCAAHPDDCAILPEGCAHSENTEAQRYTCMLKANAFWWMLARLAGWNE
jgi:hypothetical protein